MTETLGDYKNEVEEIVEMSRLKRTSASSRANEERR
jgi:hypothetical protein